MDNLEQNYEQKVWQFLDNLESDSRIEIQKICLPENKNKFIACVKSYMDTKEPYQGYITFNHDYTRIYKSHSVFLENEKKTDKK